MDAHSVVSLPEDAPADALAQLGLPAAARWFGTRIDAFDHMPLPDSLLPVALAKASAKRKREFIAGRHCATRALHAAGQHGAVVGIDERGLPAWPAGWTGSISHCSDLALALVVPLSACDGVGIDIENWIDPSGYIDIVEQVALPGELARLPGHSPEHALSLLFSAKETLYKALFPQVGQFFDFHAASVRGATTEWIELELRRDWSRQWRRGRVLRIHYACLHRHVVTALYLTPAA